MKKLLASTVLMVAAVAAGGPSVDAASYPPTDPGRPSEGVGQSPIVPGAPQQGLPATGSGAQFVLQVGLITLAAGGVLVGASSLRRRAADV